MRSFWLWAAATAGAAVLGGFFTNLGLGAWYDALAKPAWNPPAWVFSPVWTALYAAMAVAVWRAQRAGAPRGLLALFALQLALNAAWPGLFFALGRLGAALALLFVLWAAVAYLAWRFFRLDAFAGALMAPYAAWLSFALALNAAYWRLNP